MSDIVTARDYLAPSLRTFIPMIESASFTSPLTDRINTAFNKSPYLAKNQVKFITNEGHVRLEGKVGSFFQKQMAQEIVRRLDGVQRIENQLQVNWDNI